MKSNAFPALLPREKPTDRALSAAMARMYDVWNPQEDRANEFYSNFYYSRLTGLGPADGASPRDPSKVLRFGDTYYVWYTRRKTAQPPTGIRPAAEVIPDDVPATDWDLADIFYATSKDGFHWEEQGVAVGRNRGDGYASRSLSTPDVLAVNGKFYLFFQAFTGRFTKEKGDHCDVSMAWAESPDGPWTRLDQPVVPLGTSDDWDGGAIHDPYPLVYKGQIWLYYKGEPPAHLRGPKSIVRAQGVAIADRPEGPYRKPELNPITNSGHETCLYPFREGIAAMLIKDGPEKNTIQYAPDGLNFELKSIVQFPPQAGGPFCPDAFAGDGNGRGITWGLSHIAADGAGGSESFLIRFDCDLHRDTGANRAAFKGNAVRADEGAHFQRPALLADDLKAIIQAEAAQLDGATIRTEI